jgi:hypothetical protein
MNALLATSSLDNGKVHRKNFSENIQTEIYIGTMTGDASRRGNYPKKWGNG